MGKTLPFSSLLAGHTQATLQIMKKKFEEAVLFLFHPHPNSVILAARELFTGLVVSPIVAS